MAADAPPRIAVVIVNRDGAPHLGRALAAIGAQTLPPARTIVVDNDSRDGSADGLEGRHPGVEVLRAGRNLGFAAGNNLGVGRAGDCDWVALVNPDAFAEPECLARLATAAAAHPEASAFGAQLVMADAPELLDGSGDVYHVSGLAWRRDHGRPRAEGPPAGEIFSPCAAAALYRREAFLAVGGFDERWFCYFEDLDLAFRLRLAGHRCRYVPEAVVHHVGSAITGRDSDFTIYHSHRNLVWTYVRDMPGALLWRCLPQHLAMTALTLAWYASRGQGRVVLRAKRDALRGLPHLLRERRRLQRGRRAAPAELRAAMQGGLGAYRTAAGRARRSLGAARR